MTPLRGFPAGAALSLLLLAPSLAPAAWDNVFQVTCCHKRPTTAAYYAAPVTACAPPCPAPCPSVAYVQRSYYTPVTNYVAETRYEPVTSYRTSYYYEPVTSYTYSSYYDPCSCSCQQVATPVTSYRLRSQCNAVTNYVARVSYRPVTTYRQSCYLEAVPVNPCCPTAPTPVAAAPPAAVPGTPPPPPALNLDPGTGAGLGEQRSLPNAPAGAGLGEQRDQYYMPPAAGQSLPRRPTAPTAPSVKFRPERVAVLPGETTVTGQVVRNDYAPRPGARVVFVSAQRQDVRQAATADPAGRFRVTLASGGWYVYVADDSGKLTYHNQLDVRGSEGRQVTVVSR